MYTPNFERLKELINGSKPISSEEEEWFKNWKKKKQENLDKQEARWKDYEKKSAKAEKEAWIVRAKFLFKLAGTTNPIHLLKLRNLDKKEEKIEEQIEEEIDEIINNGSKDKRFKELCDKEGNIQTYFIHLYENKRKEELLEKTLGFKFDVDEEKYDELYKEYAKEIRAIAKKYNTILEHMI